MLLVSWCNERLGNYLFNKGRLIFALSHLRDLSVKRVAHQGEAKKWNDEATEPEYQLWGENRRQKHDAVEQQQKSETWLTFQIEQHHAAYSLTVVTSLHTTDSYIIHYIHTGWHKKRGHPISLQIFRKLHDQIPWKLVNFCKIIRWTQSLTFCLKISSRCGAT